MLFVYPSSFASYCHDSRGSIIDKTKNAILEVALEESTYKLVPNEEVTVEKQLLDLGKNHLEAPHERLVCRFTKGKGLESQGHVFVMLPYDGKIYYADENGVGES